MRMTGNLRVNDKSRAATPDAAHDGSDSFRFAMREFASGVGIIAAGEGVGRCGCTATAIASLSLSPPTLIVCLNRSTATLAAVRDAGAFSVNILAADHRELAERFAGRDGAYGAARFEQGDWTALTTGAPILADALAALDCRLEEIVERHTHAILIGAVAAAKLSGAPSALLHWRSQFETLA